MGAGFAQVGVLLVLTVIGLPLFFFGLMAALDHFERTLSAAPRTVVPVGPAVSAESTTQQPAIKTDAEVLTLPVAPAVSGAGPGATTGAAATTPVANPAAAV